MVGDHQCRVGVPETVQRDIRQLVLMAFIVTSEDLLEDLVGGGDIQLPAVILGEKIVPAMPVTAD